MKFKLSFQYFFIYKMPPKFSPRNLLVNLNAPNNITTEKIVSCSTSYAGRIDFKPKTIYRYQVCGLPSVHLDWVEFFGVLINITRFIFLWRFYEEKNNSNQNSRWFVRHEIFQYRTAFLSWLVIYLQAPVSWICPPFKTRKLLTFQTVFENWCLK